MVLFKLVNIKVISGKKLKILIYLRTLHSFYKLQYTFIRTERYGGFRYIERYGGFRYIERYGGFRYIFLASVRKEYGEKSMKKYGEFE